MSTLKVDTIDTSNSTGNITVSRPLSGSGASLTALNASELTSGTIPIARIADNAITLAKMAGGTDGQIITYDASGNPVAVGPGTDGQVLTSTGAGSSPAFKDATGGDKRNFIIDGNFTQWPEGNKSGLSANAYGPALWSLQMNGTARFNFDESSVTPTVAQSNVASKNSFKTGINVADTSIASSHIYLVVYFITGTDFQLLDQQQVTLAFWVRAKTTGTYCVSFQNSARSRSLIKEFTINSADTWEYKTITVTLNASGTWLYTEADVGLRISFTLAGGSDWQGTADTWLSTDDRITSNQVNGVGATTDEFYLSQVGLYLGSSAPTFTSPPISTVINQVQYYVQDLLNGDSDQILGAGQHINGSADTAQLRVAMHWQKKRINNPTISTHSTTSYYNVIWSNNESSVSSITGLFNIGPTGCDFRVNHSGSASAGTGGLIRVSNASAKFVIDARH